MKRWDSQGGRLASRLSATTVVLVLAVACGVADGRVPTTPTATSGASATTLTAARSASAAAPGIAARITVDGRILVGRLVGGTEHYVLVDGTTETEFASAQDCHPCVWPSGDGDHIAIPSVLASGQLTATVFMTGETEGTQLPAPDATLNLAAGPWSPNAERFARLGWDDADPTRFGLYTTGADGTDLRRLTTAQEGRNHEPLGWSAAGGWIAVFIEDPGRRQSGHPIGDIALVPDGGGEPRQINPPGTDVAGIIRHGPVVSFAPDGRSITFVAQDHDAPDHSAVFVAPTAGGDARRITAWGAGSSTPAWSPDGAWILFDRLAPAGPVVAIIRPDGTDERAVWASTESSVACCGVWSPTSRQLLVERGTGTARILWVIGLDGAPVGPIETRAGDVFWSRWLPG